MAFSETFEGCGSLAIVRNNPGEVSARILSVAKIVSVKNIACIMCMIMLLGVQCSDTNISGYQIRLVTRFIDQHVQPKEVAGNI